MGTSPVCLSGGRLFASWPRCKTTTGPPLLLPNNASRLPPSASLFLLAKAVSSNTRKKRLIGSFGTVQAFLK